MRARRRRGKRLLWEVMLPRKTQRAKRYNGQYSQTGTNGVRRVRATQ